MEQAESFLFGNWTVEVHRKPMRRSISIHLYPDKPIRVTAAKLTPQKTIVDFLLSKKAWIEKSFHKFAEVSQQIPKRKIKNYESFPFLGLERPLKVVITFNKKPFVSLTEQNLLLHIPRNEWSADSLIEEHPTALAEIREFYKREAVQFMQDRVQHWSRQMGLHPAQLKFREQKTRWGSCSSQKVINLNWRLIVFHPEVIDYVIVHELAHLEQMNHSPKFWLLVEKQIPDFKRIMKDLKACQYLVDFLGVK